jgi:hypothetical protein
VDDMCHVVTGAVVVSGGQMVCGERGDIERKFDRNSKWGGVGSK